MLILVRRGKKTVKPTERYHVEVGDMLVLYYLAFWVAYGITRGLRLVFRPRSRPA